MIALLAAGLIAFGTDSQVKLTRVPDGVIQPQVAVHKDGAVHLVSFKGEASGGDLFYAKRKPGEEAFGAPIRVNTGDRSAVASGAMRTARLALGGDGTVHVAWNGRNPKDMHGAPMMYTRMVQGAERFQPERNMMQGSFVLDGGGDIAADGAGNVIVIWHAAPKADRPPGESDRRIYGVRSSDGGKTFGDERVLFRSSDGACGCCGLACGLGPAGDTFVMFRNAAQGGKSRDMTMVTIPSKGDTTSSMIEPWAIATCPVSSCQMTFAGGQPLLTWESGGRVAAARWDVATAKLSKVLRPEAAAGKLQQKHPRTATDVSGRTLLTWVEVGGWGQQPSLGWQLFDAEGAAIKGRSGHIEQIGVWNFAAPICTGDGKFEILY